MNTSDQPSDGLRCAEYALGVLDRDSRRALELEADREPAIRATLDTWLARFTVLAEDLPGLNPPARVWTRITRDLGFPHADSAAAARGQWWNNLPLWRWLGAGATAAALASAAVNIVVLRGTQQPAAVQNGYIVATLAHGNGAAHWTATVDVKRARMVIVTANAPQIAADRSTELWLIAPGAKPVALGLIPAQGPASIPLPPRILTQINTQAVLAVSVEPHGGSPSGQPTGPVIATGALHAV
ncbi:anti-sigma factor [Trinickia dinghuensis]|uniref:Anti-sigma factor n=1 Tax=Trinickia dinghuensis TaxID=2291023 RepID=A0A3D8JT62_9BURK|nr:anti-sigma factor [Trinickia dinghuensis]RDU96319.1 anti-sigma factor [Trinickia dinghuensis]